MPSSGYSATPSSSSRGRGRGRQPTFHSSRHQASIAKASASPRTPKAGPSKSYTPMLRGGGRQGSNIPNRPVYSSRASVRSSGTRLSSNLFHSDHQQHSANEAGDPNEENDDTILQEVIMALNMKENATIGCAYFNTLDSVLYLSEDIPLANTDIAEQFLLHAHPTTIIISARAPEKFQEFLEKHANASQPGITSRTHGCLSIY